MTAGSKHVVSRHNLLSASSIVCELDITQQCVFLICIRRSRPASRRRTRHPDTKRHGEIDAQGVVTLRTVPAAYQADHRTSRSKLEGKSETLGAVVAHLFGHLATATQHPKIFDCTSTEVRRRLCD